MTFGDRLRKARLQKGFTQEQLAHQIGVAKSTLTGYEKGNREPDLFKIKKLLKVLEVDSDYLLGIEQEKAQSELLQRAYAQLEKMNDEQIKAVLAFMNSLNELEENLIITDKKSD